MAPAPASQGRSLRAGRVPLAAGLAAMLVAGAPLPVRAADLAAPTAIRDLYYGETLFQFYQDEHFDALTHLLAARAAGRVSNHEAESELLLGGLYLHYGQHVRAEEIFNRLLTRDVTPSVRDRAWFYLGKVRYQRGLHEDALAAFARISGALPDSLAAELPMLQAQSLMALERFDSAAELLDQWQGPDAWAPYARYNLGVAFVRLNRLADGARQLDRVGRSSPSSAELRDLRDKANLALGYAYLQQSLDGQARPVLERVRLQGPFANKALLGVGWADAATNNFRGALTPWLELRDRDLLDSAVQESLLAIPYAYAALDAHGSAAEGYQSALVSFDAEIANLDGAISRAESPDGSLINALLASDDPGVGRWYWELNELPDSNEGRYLYHLIADHRFQEGLRNVRDLAALSTHLEEWRDKLTAFEDMVDTRRQAFAQREPRLRDGLDRVDLPALQARRDAVAARLTAIEANRDVAGLATDEERDRWQRLAALGADPALAAADADALRDRHRLLTGVMAWDLDRAYKYRLWQQRRNLRELDELLARATRGQDGASLARSDTPAGLDAFASRIAAVAPRIERMQNLIAQARGQQEQRLQALAIDTLKDQRERLAAYRVQAQFALATIYDRAATAARVAPGRKQPEGAGE
ncbi:MAG: tetratricopeptide repeat protein [Chromatiales bacterium]|nr:tetratricopeptide repeat protein [Chromatiales bacterium]